ncbi:hypothetical protein ZIOFF_039034 [Zingiber officinale]|uniref:Cysteine proteinase inhibitor n=1 Tax=Zingiber officinale TaxID=94328 RepID=A0A8J5GFF3_ZINOF|nr:hypothetical protein ZIOFF_039034 [Zingiber officinale]
MNRRTRSATFAEEIHLVRSKGSTSERSSNGRSKGLVERRNPLTREREEHTNALLEFARVVKAREQVVARTLHHLTVEAVVGGEKKIDGIVILVPLFWCSLLCRYFGMSESLIWSLRYRELCPGDDLGHESGLRGWKTSTARKGANCRSPSYITAKPMLRQLPHRRLF